MSSETYANDYETSLNGSVTAARPVALTFRDAIPSSLSGGNFRVRCDGEYLLVPAGGVSGLICTGCTTVEGSTAAPHADRAVVDQVLTRQGMLNSPGPMTTQGDIAYLDSTLNPARLPLGAGNQVLTADAGTGIPKWAAASGGGGGASISTKVGGMYRNAALALTTAAFTKMPFDTALPNMDNSNIVLANSRYVADVAGVYHFDASARFDASPSMGLAFFLNGLAATAGVESYDGLFASSGDDIGLTVYLAAGDYIELFYYVATGANIDQTNYPKFATRMVGYRVDLMGVSVAASQVARMYRNAALTLTAAAFTKFPFDTVDYDPQAAITIGSNQYTAPITGKYLLSASIYSQVPDRIALQVKVNGSVVRKDDKSATYSAEIVTQLNLVAGDVVTLEYFAANADAVQLGTPTSSNNFLEIALIAASGAGIVVPQGPVIIPGFAGSADIQPASPAAADDEFEVTSAALPVTGWTNGTQAPSAGNVNTTAKSHLYLKSVAVNDTMGAIFKAAPATPFTMIAKISEHTLIGAVGHLGIFIADASPPVKAVVAQMVAAEASTATVLGGDLGTAASYTSIGASPTTGATDISTRKVPWAGGPVYLKMVVTAINNVSIYMSYNGKLWIPIVVGYANGVGLAAASYVGLYVDASNNGPVSLEALFDWIRFS